MGLTYNSVNSYSSLHTPEACFLPTIYSKYDTCSYRNQMKTTQMSLTQNSDPKSYLPGFWNTLLTGPSKASQKNKCMYVKRERMGGEENMGG